MISLSQIFKSRDTAMQDSEQLQSVIFFLSDHLCSAIEEGEMMFALDYTASDISPDLTNAEILERLDDFHIFLDEVRTQEFLVLTKINQARHWCIHLRHIDAEFKPVIDLFNTATSLVADIENVLGVDEQAMFNGEGSLDHFIESRKLVVEKTEGQGHPAHISIDENFLIGGKVPLVDLMEACNAFLDSVDVRYDVMEDAVPAENVDMLPDVVENKEVLMIEDQTKTA